MNAGVGKSWGFNVGSSNHDSAWVNDVTELRGDNVDINVGGKTSATGAVIAVGEDGDLQLGTKTLVKVGEVYEWLDNKTGGNLEETLDATAVIGSVVATAKVAGKIDDVAKAGNKVVWDNIKPVLENNPNTMIPKANATRHYIR